MTKPWVHEPNQPQHRPHAVIVLASGLSTRLGQAKQLLTKEGEPLIRYMVELALSTQPQAVIVVVPADKPRLVAVLATAELPTSILRIVTNKTPESGMAHSLSLGIKTLASFDKAVVNRVLIIGIDQVLLDKSHLSNLLSDNRTVVASRYDHWQPPLSADVHKPSTCSTDFNKTMDRVLGLPLVIERERLEKWQPALSGDKGLRHLIRDLPDDQISTVDNHRLSYDIDTPGQLTYAKRKGWLDDTNEQ